MNEPRIDLVLLKGLLSRPTAPFGEGHVVSRVERWAAAAGISRRVDRFGNLLLSTDIDRRVRPAKCRVGFTAHMDHHGFEVTGVEGRALRAAWRGGVKVKYLEGAAVRLFPPAGEGKTSPGRGAVGRVAEVITAPGKARPESLVIYMEKGRPAPGWIGSFDLVSYERAGDVLRGRAMDDLCGCAVVLSALAVLKKRGVRGVLTLLTRAEEDGFRGALALADIRTGKGADFPPLVNVETSKSRAGARPGGGVVIRLGDARTVFDPGITLALEETARRLELPYQRRVMDGGVCEATAFNLLGLRAGAVAIPLLNYHNMAKDRLAPEEVRLPDLDGAVRLLVGVGELALKEDKDGRSFTDRTELARLLAERTGEARKLLLRG